MNSIDLVEFAKNSRKLPSKWLAPVESKAQFKLWKVLMGHFLDFGAVVSVTVMTSTFFELSLKSLLVTKSMRQVWPESVAMTFTGFMLPFMVLSYFFFSYFMNHGQTWGMHMMKHRIAMKSLSFKEAALWACSSMVLCFTGGLSYLIQKDKWKAFSSHDYLYNDLMTERTLSPVTLLKEIDKFSEEKEEELVEESWSRAA